MNSLTWSFVIGCAVILLTAQRAESIRCYVCIGSGCEDDFRAEGIKTEQCRTSCSKIKIGGLYTRGCSMLKIDDDCEEEYEIAACSCNEDLCNGSSTVMSSALVMGTFIAVAFMLKTF